MGISDVHSALALFSVGQYSEFKKATSLLFQVSVKAFLGTAVLLLTGRKSVKTPHRAHMRDSLLLKS